jgi:hypothetical protein
MLQESDEREALAIDDPTIEPVKDNLSRPRPVVAEFEESVASRFETRLRQAQPERPQRIDRFPPTLSLSKGASHPTESLPKVDSRRSVSSPTVSYRGAVA